MRESSLRRSLVWQLVVMTTVAFLLVGSGILLVRLPQIETRTLAQLNERSAEAERLLEFFTTGVEAQLRPLVHLAGRGAPARMQDLLDAIAGDGDTFQAVLVVAADGRVEAIGLPPKLRSAAAELRGTDFSANPLVREARAAARSGVAVAPIWSDKYLSPLAGKNTVGVAIPVGDRLVIGETSLDRILQMLKDALRREDAVSTVIDRNGQWLASSNRDPNPPGRYFDFRVLPEFQAALEGRRTGRKMTFLGYPIYATATVAPKLHWVIASSSPAGWGNYSYRLTIIMIAAGFSGALLISLALAPFWAARMARPLKALIDRTHGVIKGDFASPWPRRGSIAELNQLSRDLAHMVETIQAREAGLARSEERLRATLENAPAVAVQWFDANGRVLYWNKASETMYGFTAAEAVDTVIGENPLMFLDRQQAGDFVALLQQIARTDEPFGPAEFPLRRKDGSKLVVLASTFAIPGDEGGRIFVCMDVDVTERKRGEAALLANEQKLEAIFNASPAAMSVSDVGDGFRAIAVNVAWEKQFRRARVDSIGRYGAGMDLWRDPADRERFLGTLERDGLVSDMETDLVTGDGARILCRISALVVDIGSERLLLMMTEDVTERRRIEREISKLNAELEERVELRTEELSHANDELKAAVENLEATQEHLVQSEKLAALGNLVAGIAHEINTPIGNGLLAVTTLADRLAEFRSAQESGLRRSDLENFLAQTAAASDIATRNLRRAADLVISFKQVAVDQTSDQRRSFDLAELVREIVLTLQPTLKRTPYAIETAVPEKLVLDSYPGALGQVLTNLITNAVLHAFEGRDHGNIRIEAAAAPGKRVQLTVSDDGIGIPAALQKRVFEPFYTTRMGRGGSGLGLHICHNAVTHVLGGRISLASREGAGAEFTLLLPLNAPAA